MQGGSANKVSPVPLSGSIRPSRPLASGAIWDSPGGDERSTLRDVRVRRSLVLVVLRRRADRGEKFAGACSRGRGRRNLRRRAAPFENPLEPGTLVRLRQALVDRPGPQFDAVHAADGRLALA